MEITISGTNKKIGVSLREQVAKIWSSLNAEEFASRSFTRYINSNIEISIHNITAAVYSLKTYLYFGSFRFTFRYTFYVYITFFYVSLDSSDFLMPCIYK